MSFSNILLYIDRIQRSIQHEALAQIDPVDKDWYPFNPMQKDDMSISFIFCLSRNRNDNIPTG